MSFRHEPSAYVPAKHVPSAQTQTPPHRPVQSAVPLGSVAQGETGLVVGDASR
jgi:hypothetical protein